MLSYSDSLLFTYFQDAGMPVGLDSNVDPVSPSSAGGTLSPLYYCF